MNIALPLIVAGAVFMLAYRYYAQYLSGVFGENAERRTPAHEVNDGVDFVPTRKSVLFAHHFSAIAGAGPIIGPTIALLYGYVPVWLWIVIGGIFFGAVHDYSALFVSAREGGRSIAEVAGKTMGKTGFLLFISFTIIMIVLVNAAFLGLTVKALTSLVPLSILGLSTDQSVLKVVEVNGIAMGKIGGIASTSVMIITLFAPILGYLIYKKRANMYLMAFAALIVAIASVWLGFLVPVMIQPNLWMILLSIYTLIAAGVPVWVILQPRDFINAFILYFGMALLFFGIIISALKGATMNFPAFNIAQANMNHSLGFIWPVLFITVACGAISGFHALVAGGTSSKQVGNESDIKFVGFFGMLLESLLAVCVIVTVASGLKFSEYVNIVFPAAIQDSNPILAFALSAGMLAKSSFGIPAVIGSVFGILMVEGFIVTTLDTAVRLNRYLLEELWVYTFKQVPRIFKSYLFNSGICVVLMLFFAYTNAYLTIWPIFGTGNQLLAALTLFAVSVWLINRGSKAFFVLIPAVFMLITTIASLFLFLFDKLIPSSNLPLIIVDILLILLSLAMVSKSVLIVSGYKLDLSGGSFRLIKELEEDRIVDKVHLG